MTIVVGIVAIGLAVALVAVVRILTVAHAASEREWAVQRRELLERIQRPERPPTVTGARFEVPEQEPDEWNLVGTISHDPAPEDE